MARPRLREIPTGGLGADELQEIRELMAAAFGDDEAFDDDDWAHALGGRHFVLDLDGRMVSHASVVERVLEIGGRPLRTGYVEAVATAPADQGRGHASVVMNAVGDHIRATFELGALGTGRQPFYERLGWQAWLGPTFVRTAEGLRRTADEDGYILVLRTPASPPFDLTEPISCDWRPGDAW